MCDWFFKIAWKILAYFMQNTLNFINREKGTKCEEKKWYACLARTMLGGHALYTLLDAPLPWPLRLWALLLSFALPFYFFFPVLPFLFVFSVDEYSIAPYQSNPTSKMCTHFLMAFYHKLYFAMHTVISSEETLHAAAYTTLLLCFATSTPLIGRGGGTVITLTLWCFLSYIWSLMRRWGPEKHIRLAQLQTRFLHATPALDKITFIWYDMAISSCFLHETSPQTN